jgi:hypothetical protein
MNAAESALMVQLVLVDVLPVCKAEWDKLNPEHCLCTAQRTT